MSQRHQDPRAKTLNRATFSAIRNDKLRPQFDRHGLALLRMMALRERDVRELYRDRAPYELLQNADDVGAKRALFFLTPDGLGFVHDGAWFTDVNFLSLAEGWSDKDPKECIGHKGIGFRSVLDISPAPHIIKLDDSEFFGVRFTWGLNNGHIQETLQKRPDLKSEYERWTKHGQSACPIMAIPGEAKKSSLGAGERLYDQLIKTRYGTSFSTMFWFPATDRDANKQVLAELGAVPLVANAEGSQRLRTFVDSEVPKLLPFLSSVEEVSLYVDQQLLAHAECRGSRKAESGAIVRVNVSSASRESVAEFFQLSAAALIPASVRADAHTPKAVKQMEKASFRLSLRVRDGKPVFDSSSSFHVYFPTAEPTGFGFIVHGDFHVMPDRTRLMEGEYNSWLLHEISSKVANLFLTKLLESYDSRSVFEALRPLSSVGHVAARTFTELVGGALERRQTPFVPTSAGFRKRQDVALPPSVDHAGFWTAHFASQLKVVTGKELLIDSEADSVDSRRFLDLAGVETLEPESLLDLTEAIVDDRPSVEWWYEVYTYLAHDETFALWDHDEFAGKRFVPSQDLSVLVVPASPSPVLCLPPSDSHLSTDVPECFQTSFVFVNGDLAAALREGSEKTQRWLLHACQIVQFEATELLPRAIGGIARQLYDGTLVLTPLELGELWAFLQQIIAVSRGIKSEDFWSDIGRVPVPVQFDREYAFVESGLLIPAFLAYWPEGHPSLSRCLYGVALDRRLAAPFLDFLIEKFSLSTDEWQRFFQQSGVSGRPKLVRYVRAIGAGRELRLSSNEFESEMRFVGERQRDENAVVMGNLQLSSVWPRYSGEVAREAGELSSLQELSTVDQFEQCVQAAIACWKAEDSAWSTRLASLSQSVALIPDLFQRPTSVFRRQARGGGFISPIRSFLKDQLHSVDWAASSLGPVNSSRGYLRFSNRRFVSKGIGDDEIGDALIPYVVATNLDEFSSYQKLGIEPLEEGSAQPALLERFLLDIGQRLDSEWGQQSIVGVKRRWRLVRGAIQEAYRLLNQVQSDRPLDDKIKLAVRSSGDIKFHSGDCYFAETGSAIERAFASTLPLIDADRPYATLFDRLPVIRLVAGSTVKEEFVGDSRAAPSSILQREIVELLAPYLLAVVIAKSEEQPHHELVLRRLKERFEVFTTDRLTVKFTLSQDPSLERSADFSKFYLQRIPLEKSGAIRENHYSLYAVAADNAHLKDLDGDALGSAIAALFSDGTREDYSQTFARLISRFQAEGGSAESMKAFLVDSLGISEEAQDLARDDMTEDHSAEIDWPLVPPVAMIVSANAPSAEMPLLNQQFELQKSSALETFNNLMGRITSGVSTDSSPTSTSAPRAPGIARPEVTREQEARGKKGEEEFLRRISMTGGWMGFSLVSDTRESAVGYDFLCLQGDLEVRVEVKTFLPNGRIVLSANEVRAAAFGGDTYYLVGLIDSGPAPAWDSRILQNPISRLLERGSFDVDVKLEATAVSIFDLD
jgi:hypothetical protein